MVSKQAFKPNSSGNCEGLVLVDKMEENSRRPAFLDRTQLKDSKRVVIKMGSAVITREDGKGNRISINFQLFIHNFDFHKIQIET